MAVTWVGWVRQDWEVLRNANRSGSVRHDYLGKRILCWPKALVCGHTGFVKFLFLVQIFQKGGLNKRAALRGVGSYTVVTGAMILPPFLTWCIHRIHAAIFTFMAGMMPPMPRCPAMVCLQTVKEILGWSLL